jgi:hypothetical protein
MRCGVLLTTAVVVLLASMPLSGADETGPTKLFNGKDLTGWKKYLDPKAAADPEKIWAVKDGIILCDGSVNGYLITEKEYDNYALKLKWRWGEKVARGRNSGVFVHTVGPDKIWPKAVEAQLMADHAGDFWLVDGFQLDVPKAQQDPKQARHYLRTKDKVEKPIGEWNEYTIHCTKDGTVKLWINGELVNEGKNAELTKGKILLQSEGAEIHFKDIELTPLK